MTWVTFKLLTIEESNLWAKDALILTFSLLPPILEKTSYQSDPTHHGNSPKLTYPSSNPKLFCTSKGNWPSLPSTQGVDLPFIVTFVAARGAPQATGIGLWKLRPSAKSNCKWKYFGAEVIPNQPLGWSVRWRLWFTCAKTEPNL